MFSDSQQGIVGTGGIIGALSSQLVTEITLIEEDRGGGNLLQKPIFPVCRFRRSRGFPEGFSGPSEERVFREGGLYPKENNEKDRSENTGPPPISPFGFGTSTQHGAR
jgi:hypothetical protein